MVISLDNHGLRGIPDVWVDWKVVWMVVPMDQVEVLVMVAMVPVLVMVALVPLHPQNQTLPVPH